MGLKDCFEHVIIPCVSLHDYSYLVRVRRPISKEFLETLKTCEN